MLLLSSIVPHGVVVFFVSYDYMDKVIGQFKKTGLITKLEEKKAVNNLKLISILSRYIIMNVI